MADEVTAFDPTRTTNAQLILDAWQLGYVNPPVLDCTYGEGKWWTEMVGELQKWRAAAGKWRKVAIFTDLDPSKSIYGGSVDYRDLPFPDNKYATVCYDPPYKLNGKGGSHAMDKQYGADTQLTIAERLELIYAGVPECLRVLKVGGHLLVKVQDQVVNNKYYAMTDEMTAVVLSFKNTRLEGKLHVFGGRAQPGDRRQVHVRNNYSTLLIYKKVK